MRRKQMKRRTRETKVRVAIDLDGTGRYDVRLGEPFAKHMLESFARFGRFDLTVDAGGDRTGITTSADLSAIARVPVGGSRPQHCDRSRGTAGRVGSCTGFGRCRGERNREHGNGEPGGGGANRPGGDESGPEQAQQGEEQRPLIDVVADGAGASVDAAAR